MSFSSNRKAIMRTSESLSNSELAAFHAITRSLLKAIATPWEPWLPFSSLRGRPEVISPFSRISFPLRQLSFKHTAKQFLVLIDLIPRMFCDMKSTFLIYCLVTLPYLSLWPPCLWGMTAIKHLSTIPATSGNSDKFGRWISCLQD